MSSSYERVNFITSFGYTIRWRKQFLKNLPKSQGPVKILDLMTGMGETWIPVKKHFPKGEISALDFSDEMFKYAKQKNENQFENNVILYQQNILKNNLPGNHFDFVVCAFGLKTFNQKQLKILAVQIKRILKICGSISWGYIKMNNTLIDEQFDSA